MISLILGIKSNIFRFVITIALEVETDDNDYLLNFNGLHCTSLANVY